MGAERGPLLRRLLARLGEAGSMAEHEAILGRSGGSSPESVPVLLQLTLEGEETKAETESWAGYSERFAARQLDLGLRLGELADGSVVALRAARSFAFSLSLGRLHKVEALAEGRLLEVDGPGPVLALDDATLDVGLPLAIAHHPQLDGRGVRVAVLDNGIDGAHPALTVAESHSTCSEPTGIHGGHGTASGGCIGSRDPVFRGLAPAVDLIDIKVAPANSKTATPSAVLGGIDLALDRGAQILSMSLGFNQLPPWWNGGYGWSCPDGHCPICTAVDRAVLTAGAVVVAAAGNEHERAEAMRNNHLGNSIPTEMLCPGQARSAIAVAALQKRTFASWSGSSRAPASYRAEGPTIAAPGVNVTTTTPVPRDPQGNPLPSAPRSRLFARHTGTSIATPIVAGAAALVVQRFGEQGIAWTPALVRERITTALAVPSSDPLAVGAGRLDLFRL